MKIVILDGKLNATPDRFTAYIDSLKKELAGNGHEIFHYVLKDLDIHHCIGCWDCWVKTPGQCVFDDASREINREIINADFLLFATPLVIGFATHELKRKMDRIIPLVHPYIIIAEGEFHHRKRYDRYPLAGLLMQPGSLDTEADIFNTSEIFARTALNLKSRLAFAVTTEENPQELAARFNKLDGQAYTFTREIPQRQRDLIGPCTKLTIFNGSPRGKKGNTPILLDQMAQGFSAIGGRNVGTFDLSKTKDIPQYVEAFQNAECVLIGFPLYTDAMPGIVKEFIDALEPLVQRGQNPPLAFLVQSGFSENHHSRYVQRYLESLAQRLGSPYLGTLVRGGCEGVRMMSEQMNRKTFLSLKTLGTQLAQQGAFTQEAIDALGSHERLPRFLLPIYRLLARFPLMNWYWDSQLKRNHAYPQRFAQLYK